MSVSSFTSLNRENLIRLISSGDFFVRNPSLQPLEEQIQSCRNAYTQSKTNSSCRCGGNTRLLIPCFEALLTRLEEMKETDTEAIKTFVQYVTGQAVGDGRVNVTIYYTKNNGGAAHRYEFKA
ncbi:hypothetical protein EBZ39_00160 [bacterium]|nr:hypothetical protein [bacterium]